MDELPPLVESACAVARQFGFPLIRDEAGPDRPSICLPGVGRCLAVLSAGCIGGRIGEIGTGAGIGAAWMASAMPADCVLVTAEIEDDLAAVARRLQAADTRVDVSTGDAREGLASSGPFDLLFANGAGGTRPEWRRSSTCAALAGVWSWTT